MGPPAFRARYGPWALVAGGSVGMGAEFARQLAARGLNLALVAEEAVPLEEHAQSVAAEHGVETRTIVADLASREALRAVCRETRDLDLGLLVYNAAHGPLGRFLEQDLDDQLLAIDLNCRGPLVLAHEVGRRMAARGRGGILLMSSLSGFLGSALVAAYAATKAFNLVLGESLWDELAEQGIDVLAFCPGSTRTPNLERALARGVGPGGSGRPASARRPRAGPLRLAPSVMEVEPVVREALDALGGGPSAIAGRSNRLMAFVLHRLVSRRAGVRAVGRVMRRTFAG
jgi:short-subunit dehydrogenase